MILLHQVRCRVYVHVLLLDSHLLAILGHKIAMLPHGHHLINVIHRWWWLCVWPLFVLHKKEMRKVKVKEIIDIKGRVEHSGKMV